MGFEFEGLIVALIAFGFVAFGLLFTGVVVFIIVAAVRNAQKARELGHDPLTMETELAARAIDSSLLAPAGTIEARLAELDSLRSRGIITEAEYAKARAEAISNTAG
jgi:hypothetical protein